MLEGVTNLCSLDISIESHILNDLGKTHAG